MIVDGDLLAVRPLHALPIGLRWTTRPGIRLIGVAAHIMPPCSGEDVNLALADAVDLAEALASSGPHALRGSEERMAARAEKAAESAAAASERALSLTSSLFFHPC